MHRSSYFSDPQINSDPDSNSSSRERNCGALPVVDAAAESYPDLTQLKIDLSKKSVSHKQNKKGTKNIPSSRTPAVHRTSFDQSEAPLHLSQRKRQAPFNFPKMKGKNAPKQFSENINNLKVKNSHGMYPLVDLKIPPYLLKKICDRSVQATLAKRSNAPR